MNATPSKRLSPTDLFDRNTAIVNRVQDGLTLTQVGEEFGLSREMIRQVAKQRGVFVSDVKARKRDLAKREFTILKKRVLEISKQDPTAQISEIAEKLYRSEEEVRKALGSRLALHEPRQRKSRQQFSDAQLLDYLRTWADAAESYRSDDYDDWAELNDAPALATVILRFGTWGVAASEAGIDDRTVSRSTRKIISDLELWACVVAYLSADRDRYSFADLCKWLKEYELPSGDLVRARLGAWSQVRDTALKIVTYAAGTRLEPWAFAERVLATTPGKAERRIHTEETTFIALCRVADETAGAITSAMYDMHRLSSEPSSGAVHKIFGGWHKALVAAGLEHRANPSKPKPRKNQVVL